MTDFFVNSGKSDFTRVKTNINFHNFKPTSSFSFQKANVEKVFEQPTHVPTFRNVQDDKFYDNFKIKKHSIEFRKHPEDDKRFNDKQLQVLNLQSEAGTPNVLDVMKREIAGEGKIEDIIRTDQEFETGLQEVMKLINNDKTIPVDEKPAFVKEITKEIKVDKEKYKTVSEQLNKTTKPHIRKAFDDIKTSKVEVLEKLEKLEELNTIKTVEDEKDEKQKVKVVKKSKAEVEKQVILNFTSEDIDNLTIDKVLKNGREIINDLIKNGGYKSIKSIPEDKQKVVQKIMEKMAINKKTKDLTKINERLNAINQNLNVENIEKYKTNALGLPK